MRFIAEFEISSEAEFVDGELVMKVAAADGRYELTAKAGAFEVSEDRFPLRMWIVFEADSLDDSREVSQTLAGEAMNLLATVTSCALEIHALRYIADWSTNGGFVEALFFQRGTAENGPYPVLGPEVKEGWDALAPHVSDPVMQGAMRWYRLGLTQENNDDRFQCFWLAIEALVPKFKDVAKVADACPRCRGDLFCPACELVPTHRPYPKQVIREMVTSAAKDDGALFDRLNDGRNAIAHGDGLKSVAKDDDEYLRMVDDVGRMAHWLILTCVVRDVGRLDLQIVMPNSLSALYMRMAVHARTVFTPDADGVPSGPVPLQITRTRHDAPPDNHEGTVVGT